VSAAVANGVFECFQKYQRFDARVFVTAAEYAAAEYAAAE
jgi:hypothetical protein